MINTLRLVYCQLFCTAQYLVTLAHLACFCRALHPNSKIFHVKCDCLVYLLFLFCDVCVLSCAHNNSKKSRNIGKIFCCLTNLSKDFDGVSIFVAENQLGREFFYWWFFFLFFSNFFNWKYRKYILLSYKSFKGFWWSEYFLVKKNNWKVLNQGLVQAGICLFSLKTESLIYLYK